MGYPVVLKKSWGGGGKGIRKVKGAGWDPTDPWVGLPGRCATVWKQWVVVLTNARFNTSGCL